MNKFSTIPIILFLFIYVQAFSQEKIDLQQEVNKYFEGIDKSSIKTGFLLNKGFPIENQIRTYEKLKKKDVERLELGDLTYTFTTKAEWERLYIGLTKADMKEKKSLPDFESLRILPKAKHSENTNIPIGFLFVEGEFLTKEELEENRDAHSKKLKLYKNYKKLNVVAAAPLQDRLYDNEVTFEISPEWVFSNKNGKIKTLEIDFSDGRGFVEVDTKKSASISVKYESLGEKALAFRVTAQNETYLCYSKINVLSLGMPEADLTFEVSAAGSGNRVESVGGWAEAFVGCDGVFDRPVIIIEGFDANNETNTADMNLWNNYGSVFGNGVFEGGAFFASLDDNGFDRVLFNFADGGDFIQDNAQVIQNLIQEVNQVKVGNEPITIIGESMGGLVARYALLEMEDQNINHNVGLFISYDSPHRGANVSVGMQKLAEDMDDVNLVSLLNLTPSDLQNVLNSGNSPAAKQMLIRYKGLNPHPEFTALQNEFDAFGNNGWPQQSRNIALVNGALNGQQQDPVNDYDPGDLVYKLDATINFLLSARVRVRTNNLNASTKVSSLWILTGAVPTTIKEKTYNFDGLNYDIAPGGWFPSQAEADEGVKSTAWYVPLLPLTVLYSNDETFGRDAHSFVPLFSAVDMQGNITTQADISRSRADIMNNNLSPLAEIYGNNNVNTQHVEWPSHPNTTSNAWTNLFTNELNLNNNCTAINTPTAPPMPTIIGDGPSFCWNESASFEAWNDFLISDGFYEYNWTVTGGGNTVHYTGEQITLSLPPGVYTLTCVARQPGDPNHPASIATSRVIEVYGFGHPQCGPGRRIGNDIGTIELLEEKSFTLYPNPAHTSFNLDFNIEEETHISVQIMNTVGQEVQSIIQDRLFTQGSYTIPIDTKQLQNGMYLVKIVRNGQQEIQKVLISK